MVSSSQEVPPDPQRRLESKDLPSIRCLGKGLSGFIYETTWLGNRYTRKNGNRYTRKDFPLGSAKHNYVFEKEVKFLFDLNHPNIVKCFGYTIGKSSCSLLQEYEDDNLQNTVEKRIEAQRKTKRVSSGSTLRSRVLDVEEINRLISSKVEEREITDVSSKMDESTIPFELPQELPQAVDIISQIATGMEYLHDNGIAHGDLKPNNVLVYSESGEMKVKVADFGLIETKKRIKLVSKRTRHFEILMWKAPERLEKLLGPQTKNSDDPFTESDTNSDEEIVSSDNFLNSRLAMADVYSYGLIFSYIFGGELMHSNLSLTQLRTQRANGFRPKMPSACPGYLKFIISSCLQFEPSKRPTFFDICTMLKGAISELPRLMRDVVGEMKKDGHLVGEMKNNGVVGEMKKDGHLVGEMKNNGVLGEMKKDDLVGEMKKDDLVGEMKKDDLVGEMKKDDLVGEMKKDDLVGEMKKDDLVGEMKKDDLVGEMKKDDLVGEMKKGDPVGELKKEGNIEGKSIYKNLEHPSPTKPRNLTSIPFLPYEDVYQGMMKDKNLEQPSLNRSRDVKSYFFPAKIQGFRLRGRSRPYSAEEEKICKGKEIIILSHIQLGKMN